MQTSEGATEAFHQPQNEETSSSPASFAVLRASLQPFDYDALVKKYEAGIAQDEADLNDAFKELDAVLTQYRARLYRRALEKRELDEEQVHKNRVKLVARDQETEVERERIVQVLKSISEDVERFKQAS